jgi:arsenate reductase (thioredoxin)
MTETSTLTLAQRNLVKTATARLKDEFAGIFAAQTIERFITDSLDQLLGTAKIVTFVPIFVERFTRDRLKALAKVEGKIETTVPSVLFLCVHNAGRSQMAAAWMKRLAGDQVIVYSGGSMPDSEVNPAAIDAMAEVGIDIRTEFPKPWTDEMVRAVDVVVTMGCGDACPIFPGKKYEDWEVPDPAGLDVASVRAIRDDIGQRVRRLIGELDLTT